MVIFASNILRAEGGEVKVSSFPPFSKGFICHTIIIGFEQQVEGCR